MNSQDFRKEAHKLVDWMADYFENIEQYPVKSQLAPQDIYRQIPDSPPQQGEPFEQIFEDFQQKILPGITHWQHPSFFAYFNGNNSFPSVLGEMLTATLAAQCMVWDTSPAAAELEEKVMNWLKEMMGIPANFEGVIQDTASTATLCALLTAREKFSNYQINQKGFQQENFMVYASSETHSSIDKAVKIAGLGIDNLRKIPANKQFAMIPEELDKAIRDDLAVGKKPLCVIATVGTTSSTAIDPVRSLGEICQKYGIFYHIDAAYAGTAALLPEKRWILDGIELADTYLFNPHKWMFTNFDCTAYFVKDKKALIRTFEILPEYLKTQSDALVNNYRDWGIQLGRRFRALKLWFVIRSFGVEGIQNKLRKHLELAQWLKNKIEFHPDFEILAPLEFNLLCLRYKPQDIQDEAQLDFLNQKLIEKINRSGKAYLTHTRLKGTYTIRIAIGQTSVEARHIENLWEILQREAALLNN
ncbi:MAG: pyridoxal-dependent decarboxylase [Microscillaceae bacterium]|nr:pyridoxal-dependent decarboxylase [Microscillaceae bacterium]